MTKRAQLPDGTILEFPDETPDAVMDKAVKSHIGGSQNGAVASFGDALQHHVMSPLHGAAQLVEHGVNAAANALLPQPEQTMSGLVTGQRPQAHGLARVRQAINDTVASDDAALAKREADYQARTPDGAAASAGAVAGEVAPFLLAGPSRILQSAGDRVAGLLPEGATLLRKLASFGTQGGLIGASQPVTGGDYGRQKTLQVGGGVVTGMALPAAVSAVRGGARLAAPIVAPQRVANSQLARLFGSDAGTLDKLTNTRQFVPGEQVTAAQAIQTPQAVMVEKALRNRPDMRAQFADVDNANNAARMNVVRGHAGDEEAVKQAARDRRTATSPYIQKMQQGSVDPAPVLDALTRLQAGSLGVNPVVRGAVQEAINDIRSRVGADGKMGADLLDATRQNIGAFLAKHAPHGAVGSKEEAAFVPIKAQIVRALDAAVPGYRDYLATYAQRSVPINTMEASQRILAPADTGGLNSAGDSVLTLARLNSGLNKADKSRYGLSPQARGDMQGVRQSLQRSSISNSVNSPGSDTAYNLAADGWLAQQLYGPTMQGPTGKTRGLAMLIGGYLGNHAGVPGGELAGGIGGLYINKAAETINARVAQRVGRGAADSQEAARMIRQFLATQNSEGRARLLQRYPQWAALVADEPRRISH